MPLTLISRENVPLAEIRNRLIEEGVPEAEVFCSSVDELLKGNDGDNNKSELFILISPTQDFISTGGMISSIRNHLNPHTATRGLYASTHRLSTLLRFRGKQSN